MLHGVAVADPYRWLEAADAPDTVAWVAAQNERTRQALDARPDRGRWHERLVALLGARVSTGCRLAADRVFTLERAGGQAQFALVVRSATVAHDPGRVLLDPSALAADATVAIDWYHPSPDGRLVAYGTSEGGDERSTLRLLDVETGAAQPDVIPDTRAASLGWFPDGSGFLYTRYPAGDEYHRMVYAHVLGTDGADDPLVWGELPAPEAWPDVQVSPDGRWALVHVLVGWGRVDVHLLDRPAGSWRTVISGVDALTQLTFDGDRLRRHRRRSTRPRGRIVAAPLGDPSVDRWTTLVPEGDGVLDACLPVEGGLLVASTAHAIAHLHHVRRRRRAARRGRATRARLVRRSPRRPPGRAVAFLQLESFTRPASLWRLGPRRRGSQAWDAATPIGRRRRRPGRRSSSGRCRTPRSTAPRSGCSSCTGPTSRPGPTRRACSPVTAGSPSPRRRRGRRRSRRGASAAACTPSPASGAATRRARRGTGPGAVSTSKPSSTTSPPPPTSSSARAGRRATGWRSAEAATAACSSGRRHATPRPARAVHCAVPLLDMIRYPQFLIARLWTDEYGDPDIAEEFGWLHAYSPYHHVVDGTCYPAVLFTAAEGDSRVDALHARKMAAALQRATSCGGTTGRSSCARRAGPVTAWASRCRSRPTSSPTCSPSSPGS